MKKILKAGLTDQTIDIFIQDSSSTTGAGLSGLVFNTASLACYYRRGATGSATQLTLATQTVGGAHSDGGFVEIQATNMKGMYRLDLSDAIIATGVTTVTMMLYGATNMAPLTIELQLVSVDLDDVVRMGLTAIPNVAQGNAGQLPTATAAGLVTLAAVTHTGAVIPTVSTLTGHTAQTGDSFARIGAAGAGLTAVPWNASWDAEVQSEVEDALVVHRLDELLNADSDIDGAAPPTVGSVFHELMTKTAGSFTYDQTTDSLEAVRDRGDAAWITATGFSTHSAADVWAVATRALTDKSDFRLSTTGVADIWAYVIEGTWTAVMYMRLFGAALLAKCSGLGTTTAVFRDVDDTKNRLSVTVDSSGNRSAFGTRDGT